jgi:ankyrin repeat protein/nucleoside phosphorylase
MASSLLPQIEDYRVGWICAVQTEYVVACELLDEYEPHNPYHFPHDENIYMLGRIHDHHVVVACLPKGKYGLTSAASVATNLRRSFTGIQIWLMVGIGGGAPSKEHDIRLGDVVVSTPTGRAGSVIHYEFGKTIQNRLFERTGSLNTPPTLLLNAVQHLATSHERRGHQIEQTVNDMIQNNPRLRQKYQKPDSNTDILYQSSFVHPDSDASCIEHCYLHNDQIVRRTERDSTEDNPVIHYGLIASADRLMKDAQLRDQLASSEGVLCFEMEAAGLLGRLQCLVIRGICDYSDTHKNDSWQGYAAATAAAYAKELLKDLPAMVISSQVQHEQTNTFHSHSRVLTHHEVYHCATTYPLCNAPSSNHDGKALEIRDYQMAEGSEHALISSKPFLTEEQLQRYFESLKFDQIDTRYASIKAAHVKTCKWLLTKFEYKTWLDDSRLFQHHGFLWTKGNPGSGKSTTMKFLFANLRRKMLNTIIIAFFFNARGEEIEKSTLGMYRSLLFQLLEKLPELRNVFALHPVAMDDTGSPEWDTESLQSVLSHVIRRLGERPLICFVDALDECDADQVQDMVTFFEYLGQTARSSRIQFRTCFSSRHYPHITIEHGISLILEDQEGHRHDIADYLASELKIGRSKKADKIRAEMLEKASGIFLWVILVVQILNKEYNRGRMHALEKRLLEIPNGLTELFNDILTRDGQYGQEHILCLQWVLYARRPLRSEELYFAILAGIEPDRISAWDQHEITQDVIHKFILDSSKGLVEQTKVKPKTLQFIHESVRDFFLKESGLDRPEFRPKSTFSARSHDHLKQCCENYLVGIYNGNYESLKPRWHQQSQDHRQKMSKSFPFLEYAVHNVLYHSDAAHGPICPQNRFLEEFRLPAWIFVNNLFERYETRRHSLSVTLLYILAEEDLPNLIRIEVRRVGTVPMRDERYSCPLVAALAARNENAVRALLPSEPNQGADELGSGHGSCCLSDHDLREAVSSFPRTKGNLKFRGEYALLSWAVRYLNFSLSKVLLENNKVNTMSVYSRHETPLKLAAVEGNTKLVKFLLAQDGIDINLGEPLSWAVNEGHEEVVKLLLAQDGIDINLGKPLSWAVKGGHEEVVKLLLAQDGIEINFKDYNNQTPILIAAENGHTEVVKLLLAQDGIEINFKDYKNQTPIWIAAENGHTEVVKLLLAQDGIEVNSKDYKNRTPIWTAAENGHTEVVELLLIKDGISTDGWKELLEDKRWRIRYVGLANLLERAMKEPDSQSL